jgi:hypothetical protein
MNAWIVLRPTSKYDTSRLARVRGVKIKKIGRKPANLSIEREGQPIVAQREAQEAAGRQELEHRVRNLNCRGSLETNANATGRHCLEQ